MVDTTDLGLWYIKGCSFDLVEYCDADYVEDEFEIKRTSGESQFYALKLSLALNLNHHHLRFILMIGHEPPSTKASAPI